MLKTKKLGIWMDHASAHVMEFLTDSVDTKTIISKSTHEEKVQSMNKGESQMHVKEQHQQVDYYRELGEVILNYHDVFLFGPTDAKVELFHILRTDHRFAEIKIEVKKTDKMSENQQHAFVKEHFLNK